jgi:hypothetical protein
MTKYLPPAEGFTEVLAFYDWLKLAVPQNADSWYLGLLKAV